MNNLYKLYVTIFYITITVASLQTVKAHNGKIDGAVFSLTDNEPLQGAQIRIVENGFGTVTNDFGKYSFTDLTPGSYNLEIYYLGYSPTIETVEVIDNKIATLKTSLEETVFELQSFVIQDETSGERNTIAAIDLELRPNTTAQDALRLVPGLFIAQHAGGGKAEQIFLRGFDIDHGTDVSIHVDGMPVNMVSHAHGQGYADLHFVIPETIADIDFQKGPYNAEYGDFTTAGYVHFNTMQTLDNSIVKLDIGQFNTQRTLVMLDLSDNASLQSAYIAGEFYKSDGPFESPQNLIRTNLFGKYHVRIGNDKIISITASTFNSRWDASGQIPVRAVESGLITRFGAIDDTEGGETGRSNLNLMFTKLITNTNTIKHQLYYTRYHFNLFSNFTFYLEDSINGDMIQQSEVRNLYGYTSKYTNYGYAGKLPATTEAGIGLRYDQIIGNTLSHVKDREVLLNHLAYGDINQFNFNVYVRETIQFNTKFSATAALRFDFFNFAYNDLIALGYDYVTATSYVPSMKLLLNFQANNNMLIYAYGGTGFHSNDTRVVVANNGYETLPQAFGGDIGFKTKLWNKLIINPAVWILYMQQEFVYVGDAAVVEPSGKTLRQGIDLSARLQLAKWLFADVDINYTVAKAIEEAEGENFIPLVPAFTSIGGVTVKAQNGITSSIRYRYMDARPANETGSVMAEGYFVNDFIYSYKIKKYEFAVEIQNIFNVKWNEAQFDTESRLEFESEAVSELHFTPGTPFFAKISVSYLF